jgi:hypothetical protein
MLAALALLAVSAGALASGAGPVDQTWRSLMIASGPAAADELPQGSSHEWWYVTVQNPNTTPGCPARQLMVTFIRDLEAGDDHVLFTTVIDGVASDRTLTYPRGSLVTNWANDSVVQEYRVTLDDNYMVVRRGVVGAPVSATVSVHSGDATLDLHVQSPTAPLWYRRSPEGLGSREIVFAPRTSATGTLTIGDTTCAFDGSGYFEHVWGDWSRVPMWGVDFINAHLDNGWSVVARRTPMRGESSAYAAAGVDPDLYWPPSLMLSDGVRTYEAAQVSIEVADEGPVVAELGIPGPSSYTITASEFSAVGAPAPIESLELTITDPVFALIFLETTTSGILEGWGTASAAIDGAAPVGGTAELEAQRYATAFPH